MLETRPYQLEAWESLESAREAGKKRALLCLATGLGKTSVAAVDALRFVKQHNKGRILFAAHIVDISDQARATFARFDPTMTTMRLTSRTGHKDADAVFTTYQTLYASLGTLPKDYFDYIIWDESHHIEAATFKAVCEYFEPKFELGLTATPKRADEKDITLYFGKPVYTKKLAEGIAEGWLSSVDYRVVVDDAVKEAIQNTFQPKNLSEINKLFKNEPRNQLIAENVSRERHKIGLDLAKTIVFCSSISHAEEMAKLLNGKAYHSGITPAKRSELLSAFKSGKVHTLCTRDMFNEGVDIPDARLIVFLRSTSSSTIFEQQIGRGLRRYPGKESVTILDFVANLRRIVFIRQLGKDINTLIRDNSGKFTSLGGSDLKRDSAYFKPEVPDRVNFEFESLALDLLKIYDEGHQPLPDDYISLNQARLELGVVKTSIYDSIKRLKVPTDMFTIGRHTVLAFPRSYLQTISDDVQKSKKVPIEDIIIEFEKTRSIQQVANTFGVSWQAVKKRLKKAGIETSNALLSTDNAIQVNELAQKLGVGVVSLKRTIRILKIPMNFYAFSKIPSHGIEKKFVKQIEDYINVPMKGMISVAEGAEQANISASALRHRIKRMNINICADRLGKAYITKDDFKKVIAHLAAQENIKDSIISDLKSGKDEDELAAQYNISKITIRLFAYSAGIKQKRSYLPKEYILEEYLQLGIEGAAKKLSVTEKYIKNRLSEFPKSKALPSTEQIKDHYDQSKSIVKTAKYYGISKSTVHYKMKHANKATVQERTK